MPRTRKPQINSVNRFRKIRLQTPTSKELDLLLLAGCSCLLTVIYHPVADALQSFHSNSPTSGAVSSQMSTTHQASSSVILSLPPKRDEIQEDEEEPA